MPATFLLEVAPKKGAVDPVGRGLENTIHHLGFGRVKRVMASQLYRLAGRLSEKDRARIGRELLCDPIVQDVHDRGADLGSTKGSKAAGRPIVIDVWYKAGVTDVVGESVAKGIEDLGIGGVETVRAGMRYRFWGLPNKAAADRLALALLVNPLVQERLVHAD